MLSRCRSVAVVVAATSVFSIPAAAAGPPAGGGGCHMVASPTTTGLVHMMVGSAKGEGAANMVAMLGRFSPQPFCGL